MLEQDKRYETGVISGVIDHKWINANMFKEYKSDLFAFYCIVYKTLLGKL